MRRDPCVRIGPVLAGSQIGKEQRHIVVRLALIGLKRQQIIGALIDNELRNGRLAADRVNRDQATCQVERPVSSQ